MFKLKRLIFLKCANYNNYKMGNKGYQVQPNLLFWIKLKTLQTNNQINKILEIAFMYTDMKLSIWQSGSPIVIQCEKEILDGLDEEELEFLKKNGLYEECINSAIGLQEAESMIMRDIEYRNIARGQLLAAGKQVHLTKYALMHQMPKLYDFLHYRIFDLDSVALAVQRFMSLGDNENEATCAKREQGGKKTKQPQRQKKQQMSQMSHWNDLCKRAYEEVLQDIRQLQFYFQHALNDN